MQIGKPGAPVSHISQAYPDRVEVRGRDLTGDLMGRLSFTEYFHLLLTGDEPTEDQRYFLDLLLVAIAEHGMMPTNVAARMTLAADPGSLHGRRRRGDPRLRPGHPRHVRGVRAAARGRRRRRVARRRDPGRGRREIAARAIRAAGGKLPGFGHPVHRPLDPRAERILELADERGVSGPHVAARARVPRRRRRGLGPAADDERLDADRRRDARPRLPAPPRSRRCRSSPARPACSPTSPRSASSRSAS